MKKAYFIGKAQTEKSEIPTLWSEEDEEAYNMCYAAIPKAWKTKSGKLLTNWLKDKLKFLRLQSKQKWSEEDENMLQLMILHISRYKYIAGLDATKIVDFLKSLRPSWKPNSQELGALRTAVSILTEERSFSKAAKHIQDIIDVFDGKELRMNWKPSEEQMAALNAIVTLGQLSYAGQGQYLIDLYNDLQTKCL